MSEARGAFARELDAIDLKALTGRVYGEADVQRALGRHHMGLDDLAALLSPAAAPRLEEIAQRAQTATWHRFGRAVRLFAPLYLSNACLSSCVYCGFARTLPIVRATLALDAVDAEARLLAERGFGHLLLVAGEHRVDVSPDYLVECVQRVSRLVPSVSIETQTWSDDTYDRLVAAGLDGVVCYQETYDRARYREVHPAGWKRDFDRRLNAMERAAEAGARRIGVGALIGLHADWRADVLAVAAHAAFLLRRYPHLEVTVSLPRIRESAHDWPPVVTLTDAEYTQAIAALRLFEPAASIVLSTRERAGLRDGLVRIAVTQISAGSATEPGGYTAPGQAQEQFEVVDRRSLEEIVAMLASAGYDPVYRDTLSDLVGWRGQS